METTAAVHPLLSASRSSDFASAIAEWVVDDVYVDGNRVVCACDNVPTSEACTIRNTITGMLLTVGCAWAIEHIRSAATARAIIDAINAVKASRTATLPEPAMQWALEKCWLTRWEYNFYVDADRPRTCTEKEHDVWQRINRKAIAFVCSTPTSRPSLPGELNTCASTTHGQKVEASVVSGPQFDTAAMLGPAREAGVISEWERTFLLDILEKSSLTDKQREIQAKIERKMQLALELTVAMRADAISQWDYTFIMGNI